MRGTYTAVGTISSFTTGDILEIKAPAGEAVELLEAHFEVQDPKAREDMDISIYRQTVPSTGGGDAVTPEPNEESDAAASSTVKSCGTALTGDTQGNVCHRRGYPVETGWHYTPTPESRKRITGGSAILFSMNTTLTSGTLIFCVEFAEMG